MATTKETAKEKTYTENEVKQLLADMKEQMKAEFASMLAEKENPKVIQVESSRARVTMRFFAPVSESNRIDFGIGGKYGTFYGNNFIVTVEKQAFIGDFRTPAVQNMLASRELIVLDGLTREERRQYGVEYADGECLEPAVLDSIIKDEKTVVKIYGALCENYKMLIAKKLIDDSENGTLTVSRECVEALNEISKADYADEPKGSAKRSGAFYPIIQKLNKKSEQTD